MRRIDDLLSDLEHSFLLENQNPCAEEGQEETGRPSRRSVIAGGRVRTRDARFK
jgi:hypothetical protein